MVVALVLSLFATGCVKTVTTTETATVTTTAAAEVRTVTVTATPAPTPAPTYSYKCRMNFNHPGDSPEGRHAYAFCDVVRDMTDGRIDITLYPDNTLADWIEANELVMRGDVEFSLCPLSDKYEPKLNLSYYIPYVGRTIEELKPAYEKGGPVYEVTQELCEGIGIKALSVYGMGMAGCTLKEVPPSPGDPDVPKGMKIRVMPLRLCEATYEALGYIPVGIPYAEVYSAIQTGVVDGEMGGPPFQGYQFRDIQGCWIQYNDYIETHWYFMNLDFFNKLAPVDQKILEDVASWLGTLRWLEVAAEDEEYRQKMRDYGMEIIMLTDEELTKCAEKVRREVWPIAEELVGKELMNILYEAVGVKR
ncbi:MAG TPA: DctP protein [Dehalococcoidia bacterium]|nr:DctP protein [Dehalococcoidia bacterium]